MAAQGRNHGFQVLDEFICEAIRAPSVPLADPPTQGLNGGMSVIEELVFEAAGEPTATTKSSRAGMTVRIRGV